MTEERGDTEGEKAGKKAAKAAKETIDKAHLTAKEATAFTRGFFRGLREELEKKKKKRD